MRIIDLTMIIEEGMVTYPGHPLVEISQLARFGFEGKETRKLVLGTHTGTHVDAPRHFIQDGETIDTIALERMCGAASLMDLTAHEGAVDAASLDDAVCHAAPNERYLLRFGGDKRLGSMDYYTAQPYLTEDAAHWLVARGCKCLGFDVPMPDRHGDAEMPVHKILLGAGVVLVEYLVGLDKIDFPLFDLIVAPLKIRKGDGAPARCFAIVAD